MILNLKPAYTSKIEIFVGFPNSEAFYQIQMIWSWWYKILLVILSWTYIHIDINTNCKEWIISLYCCANFVSRRHRAFGELSLSGCIIVGRPQWFFRHCFFLFLCLQELTQSVSKWCCVISINSNFWRGSQERCVMFISFKSGRDQIIDWGRSRIINF